MLQCVDGFTNEFNLQIVFFAAYAHIGIYEFMSRLSLDRTEVDTYKTAQYIQQLGQRVSATMYVSGAYYNIE